MCGIKVLFNIKKHIRNIKICKCFVKNLFLTKQYFNMNYILSFSIFFLTLLSTNCYNNNNSVMILFSLQHIDALKGVNNFVFFYLTITITT